MLRAVHATIAPWRFPLVCLAALTLGSVASLASPPVAVYLFPAGGQRGKTVKVKLGGLALHASCQFTVVGPGVKGTPRLNRVETLWFEGPILPLPDSQRAEDYPQDLAGAIEIAANALPGVRRARVWTSQGASPSLKFLVGVLPEIVEEEIDGDPLPIPVSPPLTINGRIFPREDIDLWSIRAKKGETYTCEIHAARFGSPLDARLEILGAQGREIAACEDAFGADPAVRFTAPQDGVYQIRVCDSQFQGGPAHVYRLTVSSGPIVDSVFPLGGKRGDPLTLELTGHALPSSTILLKVPADAARGWIADLPGRDARIHWLDHDETPEFVEGRMPPAGSIAIPAMLNGRISEPGEADTWPIAFAKGALLAFELKSSALGSPLDGIVTVHDAKDKELVRIENARPFDWTVPAAGVYQIRIRDRFRTRGGPAFAYRLKVAPAVPDFALTLENDGASVLRKGQAKVKLNVQRRGGFKEPIQVAVEQLPEGVEAKLLTIAPNQNAVELVLQANAEAPVNATSARVIGSATIKGEKVCRAACMPRSLGETCHDTILVGAGLPTPFVVKGTYDLGFAARGGILRRKYTIERNGFDGPLEVRLAEKQARHLQGVTGPMIRVPAGDTEFVYEALLPPWMETGRTCRVCVMATGVITEKGREHRLTFSSVHQNEQLVAVVGPGHLALDLERTSTVARPGATVAVPFRIKRGVGLKGDVTLSLVVPRHLQGIVAERCVVAADQDRGVLTIRFPSPLPGPITMPVAIRAAAAGPVRAEASLELLAIETPGMK